MSEVSLSELDCLENFLTPPQDLSQHRGSFGARVFWFGRCVYRGVLWGDPREKLMENCTGWDDTGGAAGWEVSSQVLKTSRRMSVCNAARYHVSVCVPIYRWYVQSYI